MAIVNHRVRREAGAVILTVVFTLLFLLGFMGIALDFGHLFVVKTELQTAADACALAAVQELDHGSGALDRATAMGIAVGNLNRVNFQKTAVPPLFAPANIEFSNTLTGAFTRTEPVATADYARCTVNQGGMAPWLLQAMKGFTGNAAYSATQSVSALAVATPSPAQSVCNALPVQIRPLNNTPPNYGFTPGQWISTLYGEGGPNSGPAPGQFGWGNLDGSNNANETRNELLGYGRCDLRVGDPIGTPGVQMSAATAWNSRFGLYFNGGGNPNIVSNPPDTTGYSYTPAATSWPSKANAVGDFLAKRALHWSYGGTTDTRQSGNAITGLTLPGAYNNNNMATYAPGARWLGAVGTSRRLVLAPIVSGASITDWACVLMLHPINGPGTTVYLEFVGNANAASSPCINSGVPGGGTIGPLVPGLVR